MQNLDEHGKRKYHLHVDLNNEYEPIQKRTKNNAMLSLQDRDNLRMQGHKHIDLWCDGTIYPINPITASSPPFSNPTSLLRFTGDGVNGLLGYCHSIAASQVSQRYTLALQASEIMVLREETNILKSSCKEREIELSKLKEQLRRLREKQTIIGPRQRKKKLKNVEFMKLGSGGLKKRIQAMRCVIQPDKENIDPNVYPVKQLKPLMSSKMATEMLKEKKFKVSRRGVIEQFVTKNLVSSTAVQESMDTNAVSRKGYTAIQRSLSSVLQSNKIKSRLLPTPTDVWKVRSRLNTELVDYIGEPYHIQELFTGQSGSIQYTEFNNIFLDLELLQKRMVEFYDISYEEVEGLLKFVIKLDECEIIKEKKVERVTVTLMNRALNNTQKENSKYFSVQSEAHIWWLGSFEVKQEDHETLYWVFHHTSIPLLMEQQMEGQKKLSVDNRGEFEVEWHLSGDLKTLKCLYNGSKGANSKSPCLYCMEPAKTMDSKWWRKPPNRHLADENFQAVFPIPLDNVHICTLHALCRIIEKLVYLYIGFAWKIKDVTERKEALGALEKVLSEVGLHGGNVRILKDTKKSTNEKEVPMKPSIGGVKARRFLSRPLRTRQQKKTKKGKVYNSTYVSRITYDYWKKLHNAVKDHEGKSRAAKADLWRSTDILFHMCDKENWSFQDKKAFQDNLRTFSRAVKDAWTESSITHYMHIIFNHLPYFIQKYGNPSIWNTQGMEKSHYMARNAYFRHTQHAGGRTKADSMYEVFQWFYRRILQQLHRQQILNSSPMLQTLRELKNRKEKRQKAFSNSVAIEGQQKWRQTKTFVNRRWINTI